MLRFFAGRRSRLLGLVRNGTRLNSAAVRLTRDEARGVSVTSTAAWTVARTTVPAAPTLLGPAAEVRAVAHPYTRLRSLSAKRRSDSLRQINRKPFGHARTPSKPAGMLQIWFFTTARTQLWLHRR